MDRVDWLILLLAFKGADSSALDPVRIQKGMFLFSKEADRPETELYDFKPYNYGPYCADLKRDATALVDAGVAESVEVPGYTWAKTELSAAGMARASALLSKSPTDAAVKLFEIKQAITSTDFSGLLRDVYSRYPDFATKSIFRG